VLVKRWRREWEEHEILIGLVVAWVVLVVGGLLIFAWLGFQ
jgi:flagellar basal body-associated protein FliL